MNKKFKIGFSLESTFTTDESRSIKWLPVDCGLHIGYLF